MHKNLDSNNPLFGAYADCLNGCASIESDKEAIKEYNKSLLSPESMGHWHLIKMGTVDESPIDEPTRNKFWKITLELSIDFSR